MHEHGTFPVYLMDEFACDQTDGWIRAFYARAWHVSGLSNGGICMVKSEISVNQLSS